MAIRRKAISSTTRSNRQPVSSADRFLPAVLAYCRGHGVFAHGELVIVAVSGGPDSLCVLHSLHGLAPDLGIRLHVANVHHGLRGAEADQDAVFVEEQARLLDLPFTMIRVSVTAHAANRRISIETAAREARYTALREARTRQGAACIATGHTSDDQAETLLLHLLRGSGLDGLAAMRPRRDELARPLLGQSRRTVLSFCREHGLQPREDSTNLDRSFRRNAVRADLIPALEAYNPRARAALARCASLVAADADYLLAAAREVYEAMAVREPMSGGVALPRARLVELPSALRSRVLRLMIQQVLGAGAALSAERLAAMDALADEGREGAYLEVGRGYRAEVTGDHLRLSAPQPASATPDPLTLTIPGAAVFGRWRLETLVVPADWARARLAAPEPLSPLEALCDRAALGGPLTVRSRLPGDRISPLGLRGTKKVQDILVDRKIPRGTRDQVPIIVGPHGIVWIVGAALDVRVAVTEQTTEVAWLRVGVVAAPMPC